MTNDRPGGGRIWAEGSTPIGGAARSLRSADEQHRRVAEHHHRQVAEPDDPHPVGLRLFGLAVTPPLVAEHPGLEGADRDVAEVEAQEAADGEAPGGGEGFHRSILRKWAYAVSMGMTRP